MAAITKGSFIQAASMVRDVLQGGWTSAPPPWADKTRYMEGSGLFAQSECYTRAVQNGRDLHSAFHSREPTL